MPSFNENHRDQTSVPALIPAETSFAVRTLLAIAERRPGIDAMRCRLALLHSETATLLHRSLRRSLEQHRLTDLQFSILVILFSTEPEPLSASVLAEHAGVARASITEVLDRLESTDWVTRTRDKSDRRVIYVRITAAGQDAVDAAINSYLRAAEGAASLVQPGDQRTLCAGYFQLLRGLGRSSEALHRGSPGSTQETHLP
ncbi:hypothetical protein DB347_15010 [Opitutaceae bacterium EW11]|nr:hypothetical protein DB347_15010 [Opitutaceae bacterium EW11]